MPWQCSHSRASCISALLASLGFLLLSLTTCLTISYTVPATRPTINESGSTLQQGELFLGVGGGTEVATSHADVTNFGGFVKYGLCNWLSLDFSTDGYVNAHGYSTSEFRIGLGATLRLFDLGPLKSSLTTRFSHMTAISNSEGAEVEWFSTPVSLNMGIYPFTHFGVFLNLVADPFWGFTLTDSLPDPTQFLTVIASIAGGFAIDGEKVKLRVSIGYPLQESSSANTVRILTNWGTYFEYFPSLNVDAMVRVCHN